MNWANFFTGNIRVLKKLKLLYALLLGLAAVSPAHAADHREATGVQETPAADIGDLYVFRSPARNAQVVLAMTVNPASSPDFATSYHFSPDVLYRFSISNEGDSAREINIDFLFSPVENGRQTYTVFMPGTRIQGEVTPGTVASNQPNEPIITTMNRIRVFAGPRDDPFFFDNVGFGRVLAGGQFRNRDGFAKSNMSAIVIELPNRMLRATDRNPTIAVTALTYTSAFSSAQLDLDAPVRRRDQRIFRQADRTGVPGVATVLVPPALRNAFNFAPVTGTSDTFNGVDFTNVLVESLTNFGTPAANIGVLASVAVPDTLKMDLSQPSGFPNGRQPQDDVIDTLLQLILGDPAATDGVDANDVPFLADFPYLAPPRQPRG